jgi:hypothetical protein
MNKDISILTLNLFLRPPGVRTNASDFKDLRASLFVDSVISSFDIICLQEVFETFSSRKNFIKTEAAKKGFIYTHQGPRPSPFRGTFIDSGLLILSRFPILECDHVTYSIGIDVDKLSAKGAIYVKVNVYGRVVHVFTTHLQASYGTTDYSQFAMYRLARRSQLREMKKFIDSKVKNNSELAIIAGDFNMDGREAVKQPKFEVISMKFACQDDYNHLMRILSGDGTEEICDVIRNKYSRSLSTYGIVNSENQPVETVLTGKNELMGDECLDYIFLMNFKVRNI